MHEDLVEKITTTTNKQTNILMKVAPRSIYYYERGDAPVCGRLQYLARTILSLREIFGKL